MIKVTLEFKSVDETIVALGKLVGIGQKNSAASNGVTGSVPAATKSGDVGSNPTSASAEPVKRGRGRPPKSTKPTVEPGTMQTVGPGVGAQALTVTEPSNSGQQAPTLNSTPVGPAPVPSVGDVQAVVQKLFDTKGFNICSDELARFGVKRAKDLKPEQRAEFISKANAILNGGGA